jgi:hypothetical protein
MLPPMAGVISVRFSKAERAELRRRWREGGFPHLSAYIRTKLGLDPDGGIDPVTEYEELDSTVIHKSLVSVRDRLDDTNALLKQLCRAQGIRIDHLDVPRQYTHVAPVDPPDENGDMDIPADKQLTTSALPVGFNTRVEL